jgi:acetoin utilization deacetylase AcuC-like enzyme
LKVFFSERMVAHSASYSPSAGKPAQAVASWLANGFDIDIVEPLPVTNEQFCLAHDAGFVRGVLSCAIDNGFYNKNRDVADSLPYTSGAMLAAARAALASGGFACAPVSGFHHAGWDHAGGFCTFNGLMVTALSLLEEGLAKRVGILDCDQHYGNGTDNIIKQLGVSGRIRHYSVGRYQVTSAMFLKNLKSLTRSFSHCDVLLYQAGADPHVDDPLGGWLTTGELRKRDRIVFETTKAMGLPVAWNLAGGYQRDEAGGISAVLEIHDNTMLECLAVFGTLSTDFVDKPVTDASRR